jgi:hypothetical protein|tara:strand:+ start:2975 stop:3181 length:207 start_codon:yes stop_codon:yes gene_type:complete
MKKHFDSIYSYAGMVGRACKRIIGFLEEGEYGKALAWLENLSKQATKIQVEESIEDPDIPFGDLRDND